MCRPRRPLPCGRSRNVPKIVNPKKPGWSRTGQTFKAYAVNLSDGRGEAVCRFLSPPGELDAHFLSASYRECEALAKSRTWRYEARAFDMAVPDTWSGECPEHTIPVYRLWSPRNGDHRFITDAGLKAALQRTGWLSEGYGDRGVAMCAPQ
jgi:hypothetical protein